MREDEYLDALHQGYQFAQLLANGPDFRAAWNDAERALDIGPFVDPATWMRGGDRLECDRDLFDVLAIAQRKVREVLSRRLVAEDRR